MAWISRSGSLTIEEMKNNANIIINFYRSIGFNDSTIASMLGNMQNESSINPERIESGGGGGYGLVQWTPQSVLIEHCAILGFNPYNNGDVQLKVINAEILNTAQGVNEWYTTKPFIDNYRSSGSTDDMIGVKGVEYITNSMEWTPDKLAIMFMVGYERPAYDPSINHIEKRKKDALFWFEYMGGVIPPTPEPTSGSSLIPLWLSKALTGGI